MLGSDLGTDIVAKMKINEKRVYKNGVKPLEDENVTK